MASLPQTGEARSYSSLMTARAAPLSVSVHQHIADIPASEWDQFLDAGDIQATHRFVKVCEDSNIEDATYRHVIVRREGRVAAIATFSAFVVGLDVLATGSTRAFLSVLRRVVPRFMRVPVVFCGLPVSFGKSCLRWSENAKRDASLRAAILRELDGVATSLAEETHAGVICFKEFDDLESGLADGLVDLNYFRAPSLPGCRLVIRWDSFDAYVASLRASYRRQLLASRQELHRGVLRVRFVSEWQSHARPIHRLYDQVLDRAAVRLERLPVSFFEQLATLEEARAILVENADPTHTELVAAAIVLESQMDCTFLLVGMDYSVSRELAAYHVVVDTIVERAIESGARVVELGQTSYDRKMRMGAVTTKRDLYVRGATPAVHRLLSLMRDSLFPVTPVRPRRVFRSEWQ
jgi:hypothetical protein